jgi:hypothetical protein
MINWETQDKGWHTSKLGGVAREADNKWYFYPADERRRGRDGPFKTMKEAQKAAEKRPSRAA